MSASKNKLDWKCVECGTTEGKHLAKGMCSICYQEKYYFRRKNKNALSKNQKEEHYLKFLNKNPKYLKKYQGGIKYKCDGCCKNCLIISPCLISENRKNNSRVNIIDLNLFKKIVIENCKIKCKKNCL